MVFSSVSFLYYFLPIILIFYFLVPQKLRNLVLLIGSLFFYFYGEPRYILVLIFSIIFNYYSGRLIEKLTNKNIKKTQEGLELAIAQLDGDGVKNSCYRFACPNTIKYLNSASVKCTQVDQDFIDKMISYAIKVEYFPKA